MRARASTTLLQMDMSGRGYTRTVWVTREGERVPVRNLGNRHLVNIVRMLRRAGARWLAAEITDAYGFILFLHGEMAIEVAESAVARMEDMTVDEFLAETVPTWDRLLEEAEKRKLLT